nr:hypothetical protein [Nitrospinaceae bacterium]NIR57559.1 hypothetical protein [Nitrospinaceae bacterium]NIS88029.1 hypothetical protein [Nitrospinaceae bacterium]NIT84893.1 hypothetical protein [Nitrospinaceae bacterium]NIU47069.1 hypothetical protein [Nitrospinaceae bacterium]
KQADSWMIKTILWLIILAFVGTIFYSWGMGGASASRGGVVATVEGLNISYDEYDKTFNRLINFYRDQFKNQFSEELIQRLDLKNQALEALIQRKLLLQQAEKLNIRVSDQELIDHIKSFPAFQKDGQFNEAYYRDYLKFQRLSPMEFEESQRQALIIEKVENVIKSNTKVSRAEVREAYQNEEEKIKLDHVVFPEDHFAANQPIPENRLRDFYEKNKIRFEVPEQIRVRYVKLEPADYTAEITVREEDIQDYYENRIADFRVEKRYKASHILIQTSSPEAGDDTSEGKPQKSADEKAKAEAERVLEKIRGGADFAQLAEKYSDDPSSKNNGGSLGEFPQGSMVPEFEEALEKLKVGEISEPVKTAFGYHIIRLDGKQEERIRPLEEVRTLIESKIKETKARQRLRRTLKKIYRDVRNQGDLAAAAQTQGVETDTTDFFSRQKHNVPDIGIVPEFYNAAFSLVENEVSPPVHTAEASYLIQLLAQKPPHIPELSEIREQVRQTVREEQNKKATEAKFQEMKEQLSQNKDLKTLADKFDLRLQHTPPFARADSIPGIGNIAAIKEKAFGLDVGETAGVHAVNKYFLFRVADRMEAGDPDEKRLDQLRARLHRQKANVLFQDWLANLKERSEIYVDKTLL